MSGIRRFINRIKGTDCRDADTDSLFEAVMSGNLAEVKRLVIDCGIDPNAREDDKSATPLHAAAESGSPEVVEFLLEHGADLNARDKYGDTPLHYAAAFGHPETVRLLLERGTDPNIRNKYGATPLHYAVWFCNVDAARVLLDYGADPTIRDKDGRTPLDPPPRPPKYRSNYSSECEELKRELGRGGSRTMVYE
jgi:ankyrin repeat protein